ncbi:MAG TPA: hypothetical protein VI934_04540 [Candidatus Nanoarchaeia archaeon]|nr:hypothetical protein [Candidatus Nanoarchaeia archaeon]
MSIITDVSAVVTAVAGLLGIGIAMGKLLFDVSFLKKEVLAIKKKMIVVEREQLEMKLILKQIAKKLKISY